MKTYQIILFGILFFSPLQKKYGQNNHKDIGTVKFGQKINANFGSSKESHAINIELKAGDKLNINIVPIGDYLKVRAEIRDPANGIIYPISNNSIEVNGEMFNKRINARSLNILTGVLSATGTYRIILFNHRKYGNIDMNAGEYTFLAISN